MTDRDEGLPFSLNLLWTNRTVGFLAILLPVGLFLAGRVGLSCDLKSLSHGYYMILGGDFFTGILFVIAALFIVVYKIDFLPDMDEYLGFTRRDVWLLKGAGVLAVIIAIVPTTGPGCLHGGHLARPYVEITSDLALPEQGAARVSEGQLCPIGGATCSVLPGLTLGFDAWMAQDPTGEGMPLARAVHYSAAGVMFAILAYIVLGPFRRFNSSKSLKEGAHLADANRSAAAERKALARCRKTRRNGFYLVLGTAILLSLIAMAIGLILRRAGLAEWWDTMRLTFWFETVALIAFGAAWSVKGRMVPFLNDPPPRDPQSRGPEA